MEEELSPVGDAELVKRGRAGDRGALDELFGRYEKGLYAFIQRFVGGVAEPEDVYQEICLKALRNLERFNTRLSFKTWIYTLTANHCKNVLRSRSRRRKIFGPAFSKGSGEVPVDLVESAPDGAPGPDRRIEDGEFIEALNRELRNLPLKQREVFILREYSNLAFKEIARIIRIPEATARSRMFHALEYLRVRLEKFAGTRKHRARIR